MFRSLGCFIKGLFLLGMLTLGLTLYHAMVDSEINRVEELANTVAIWVIDRAFSLLEYLSDVLPT